MSMENNQPPSPVGQTGTQSWVVTPDRLASAMKSGTIAVFATPCMVALMEYTASRLVQPMLPDGITTVGTSINVTHVNPTPLGATVRAEAEILETDGRRFVFRVTAWDESGLIGEGTHERCTVKPERLEEKAAARRG